MPCKPHLHRRQHHVSYGRSADACVHDAAPVDALAIVGIDDESGANNVTVPSVELEDVTTPAQIRSHGCDLSVVGAVGAFCVAPRNRRVSRPVTQGIRMLDVPKQAP